MKKCLTVLLFLVLFSGYVSPDLTNLMYATFPVERYEFMVDEKKSKYKKDIFNITCGGQFYISLENKIMKYTCFRLKDWREDLYKALYHPHIGKSLKHFMAGYAYLN